MMAAAIVMVAYAPGLPFPPCLGCVGVGVGVGVLVLVLLSAGTFLPGRREVCGPGAWRGPRGPQRGETRDWRSLAFAGVFLPREPGPFSSSAERRMPGPWFDGRRSGIRA